MNLESISIGVCMVLYFITGTSFALKGNFPWAIVWWSYSAANIGMILAARK
ncbi:hypothetical protein N9955_00280 [bacterium]|nr:hypothetical protein [bacterium]